MHCRDIINLAAGSVDCASVQEHKCNLKNKWIQDQLMFSSTSSSENSEKIPGDPNNIQIHPSSSAFQNMLGISSIDVALKAPASWQISQTHQAPRLTTVAKMYLESQFKYSSMVARFAVILIMKLVTTPDVPLDAATYAKQIHEEMHSFKNVRGKVLAANDVVLKDVDRALEKLEYATDRFHNTYNNQSVRLELLGHHEFSDQLMELERSFLSAVHTSTLMNTKWAALLDNPYDHLIFGPSPLNPHQITFLPRLSAVLELAATNETEHMELVIREVFFVVDALDSATCVLDNHLVYTNERHFKKA